MKRRILAFTLLLVAALATGAWLLSGPAQRWITERLAASTGGRLAVEELRFGWHGEIRVSRALWSEGGAADVSGAGMTVTLDEVRAAWSWAALFVGRLSLTHLSARSVAVSLAASEGQTTMPPALRLPFPVAIDDGRIGALRLRRDGAADVTATDLAFAARLGGGELRVERLAFGLPAGVASLTGRMDDHAPYGLEAQVRFALKDSAALPHGAVAGAVLRGTLAAIDVEAWLSPPAAPRGTAGTSDRPVRLATRVHPFQAVQLAPIAIAVEDLDLTRFGPEGIAATRLSGRATITPVQVGPDPLAFDATLDLTNAGASTFDGRRAPEGRLAATIAWRDGALSLPSVRFTSVGVTGAAALRLSPDFARLTLRDAALDAGDAGSATAAGEIALRAPFDARLDGAFRLGARLGGPTEGHWSAQGPLAAFAAEGGRAGLRVEARLSDAGKATGALYGSVALTATRTRVDALRVDLGFAGARLRARGAYGSAATDRLDIEMKADRLGRLAGVLGLTDISGAIDAQGAVWRQPDGLPAFDARASAQGLRIGRLPALRAQLSLAGTSRSHRYTMTVEGRSAAAALAGTGAFAEERGWRGELVQLGSTGALQLALRAPAALAWNSDGFDAQALQLDGSSARLALRRLRWQTGRLLLDGDAEVSRLGTLATALGFSPGGGAAQASLDALSLRLSASLSASAPEDASGRLSATLRGAGQSDGRLELEIARGVLSGGVALTVPTLGFANRIIGPEWAIDGRLGFAGVLSGTLAQPRLVGDLTGRDLKFEQRAMGWRLADGTLAGRFEGDRLRVDALTLHSAGDGRVTLRGEAVADGQGRFALRAERLRVPLGPGQRVVLSGDATGTSQAGRFALRGTLAVDEGRLDLAGGEVPTLPPDVVVVGGAVAPSPSPAQPVPAGEGDATGVRPAVGMQVSADLTLDLGERLRVTGGGLDGRIAGTLRLAGALPSAPRAFGTVRIREGRYRAYGRELDIVRGSAVFNGALDNPALDVLALRRGQTVEAGVSVTGTALSPRIRLASRPEVPDTEKLSWLVLGMPLDNVETGAQGAALQAAATTLFGSNDGALSGGLARALGLDVLTLRSAAASGSGLLPSGFGGGFGTPLPPVPGQVGIRAAPTGAGDVGERVVAVGKRLGSGLTLTYEQGVGGVWSLLRIQYDLSRRFSLRAQTGTESALDLLYRFSFD